MKKVIIFILSFLLFTCFSFGGNIDMNDISIRFCKKGQERLDKRVSLYSKAGEKTEGCLMILNSSENTGYIDLHFVSQTKTNQGEKACALPGNKDDIFVKYIKPNRSGLIYLDEMSEEKKTFELDFPVGMDGTQGGCLAFFVVDGTGEKTEINGTFLSLITRKASLFEVWIDGVKNFVNKIKLEKNGESKKILFFWNLAKSQILFDSVNKSLSLKLKMVNDGNIDQRMSLSGKIYSVFGFRKSFEIENEILERGKTLILDTEKKGVNLNIPEYQGLFWFRLNFGNFPHFDFYTSNIPHEKLAGSNRNFNVIFFVISWISIGFWILLIFVLFMIYRIFKKGKFIRK